MCILKTELWNICSICPSVYSLVSFITCFSYSAGIFISCLMFFCLECLPTMGEIQYSVFWLIMVYMLCISTIQCSWFSVYFGFMNVFPFVFKLLNQKTLKTLKTLFYFIDIIEIVLACSLVVWEQFLALTFLAPLLGNEVENLFFPGILIISLVVRSELKPANLKDYFSPVFHGDY